MNFNDIPQLTPIGDWQADYPLVAFVREIDRMKVEDGLILNPDFQRGNVWTEAQQTLYIEYILRGGTTARIVYLNHPNWKSEQSKAYTEFVCVDGLQRITALDAFVKNKLKAFGYYFNEFEGKLGWLNMMSININSLKSRKAVLEWYIDFNAGGTVHSSEEIARVRELWRIEEEKDNACTSF